MAAQIGEVAPDFPEDENVESFIKTLRDCKNFLQYPPSDDDLLESTIKDELRKVKEAYKNFLDAIRKVSIKLALKDYEIVKGHLSE